MTDLKKESPDKPVEVWYQDESRIGQKGDVGYCWNEKGVRVEKPKQQGFVNTYYYGAIEPKTGLFFSLIFPFCNTEMMNLFLEDFSKQGNLNAIKVLIMDQAGWHKSDLKIPENVRIFHLPPYSPQLNPIERLWGFLKKRFFKNRTFESYEELVNIACNAWNSLTTDDILSISKSNADMIYGII